MTKLHRRYRLGRAEYTEEHVEALTTGYEWFHPFGYPSTDGEEAVDANRRQAWEDLAETILVSWIADKPFTRPRAWWRFDAPELRRCLSGVHPYERPEFIAHCERLESEYPGYTDRTKKTWWGVPCIQGPPGLDGNAKYESERDYLIRLDLLTDYERQLLAQENQTVPRPASAATATIDA